MLSQGYLHPTGQMPAYEWNFGDVNPPVHAFAVIFLQNLEADLGQPDLRFLQECFSRLLLNFTWWVNRKDPAWPHRQPDKGPVPGGPAAAVRHDGDRGRRHRTLPGDRRACPHVPFAESGRR